MDSLSLKGITDLHDVGYIRCVLLTSCALVFKFPGADHGAIFVGLSTPGRRAI